MRTKLARTSLAVTLGVAAIDMLSCAFVSAVMLFVMFLVPQKTNSEGETGAQRLLVLHWVFASSNQTVLGIEFALPDGTSEVVYSDDAEALAGACSSLIRGPPAVGSCSLIRPEDPDDLSGMLLIQNPKPGAWNVAIDYADTESHGNADDDNPVDLRLTVIGKDTFTVPVTHFVANDEIDVRRLGALAGKASILDIPD